MLEAILFDFDGLMVETEWSSYTAWAQVFAEHNAELSTDEFLACIGTRGGIDFGELLYGKTQCIGPTDAQLRAIKQPRQDAMVATLPLLPGVIDWLDAAAAAEIPVAIASSSDRAWIEPHLLRHGIDRHFVTVTTWEGAHVGYPPKPAPDIYLRAVESLGVNAAHTLAFEDSLHGVRAAKAAGLRCVAVPNRLTRALDFSEADRTIRSLAEFALGDAYALMASTHKR